MPAHPSQTCWDVTIAAPATPPCPHIGLRTEFARPLLSPINRDPARQEFFMHRLSRASVCRKNNHSRFQREEQPVNNLSPGTRGGFSHLSRRSHISLQQVRPSVLEQTANQAPFAELGFTLANRKDLSRCVSSVIPKNTELSRTSYKNCVTMTPPAQQSTVLLTPTSRTLPPRCLMTPLQAHHVELSASSFSASASSCSFQF